VEDRFFARRDSEPARFDSVLGAPTCFTWAAGIGGAPLLGGMGGFDELCRRWWALLLNDAIVGVDGRVDIGEPLGQLRAARRSELLNMGRASSGGDLRIGFRERAGCELS
jgi:hypothetical protein